MFLFGFLTNFPAFGWQRRRKKLIGCLLLGNNLLNKSFLGFLLRESLLCLPPMNCLPINYQLPIVVATW